MKIPIPSNFDSEKALRIETEHGVIDLFPQNIIRGKGANILMVKIEGVVFTEVRRMTGGSITFNGQKFGGHFSEVEADPGGCWKVVFDTLKPL